MFIKKLLFLTLSLILMPTAHAFEAAKIKIKINGPMPDNRYFLCMQDIGCLSLLAAKKGKVFPILRPFQMNQIFVLNIKNNMKISPQGLPASCNKIVNPKQTITIMGQLLASAKQQIRLSSLRCSIN